MAMAQRCNPVRATLFACAFSLWTGGAAAADLPEAVKKLTGSSDETARNVLAQQGFALRNEKSSWGRHYGRWWSDKSRQCVEVMSLAGRVAQVSAKGESDCKAVVTGAASVAAAAASAPFDPLLLVGLPRGAAEQRLIRAGFRSVEADMSKGDTIFMTWTDGRQCLGLNIVGDRIERADEMSKKGCYIK